MKPKTWTLTLNPKFEPLNKVAEEETRTVRKEDISLFGIPSTPPKGKTRKRNVCYF